MGPVWRFSIRNALLIHNYSYLFLYILILFWLFPKLDPPYTHHVLGYIKHTQVIKLFFLYCIFNLLFFCAHTFAVTPNAHACLLSIFGRNTRQFIHICRAAVADRWLTLSSCALDVRVCVCVWAFALATDRPREFRPLFRWAWMRITRQYNHPGPCITLYPYGCLWIGLEWIVRM